jgi:hypothetical protein
MIDATIEAWEVKLSTLDKEIDIQEICSRIATFGFALDVHETFISHQGIADIYVTRLPNSTKILFDWNEDERPDCIAFISDNAPRSKWRIAAALAKYIGEYLDEA